MSAVNTAADFPCNSEFMILHVEAELIAEICSYLGVHDQLSMKRVCKWWRMNLSETYLSRLVDMDDVRMFNQSEHLLEEALNKHVQKNTKILVLRHITFTFKAAKFGIIAKVIKQKHADLLQLILKDCQVEKEFAAAAHWWLVPEHISDRMLHSLIFATRKLVLENYAVQNALNSAVLTWIAPTMPGLIPTSRRRNFCKELPIVLTGLELDCTKPFHQHFHSFVTALESHCPEVSPEVRNEVELLYNSWTRCKGKKHEWQSVGNLMKWLNEGVPARAYDHDFELDIRSWSSCDGWIH